MINNIFFLGQNPNLDTVFLIPKTLSGRNLKLNVSLFNCVIF